MTAEIDPFGPGRPETGVHLDQFEDETIPFTLRHRSPCATAHPAPPLTLRHRDVRLAASDVRQFSRYAPARRPIPDERDVRSLRQLLIKAHSKKCAAVFGMKCASKQKVKAGPRIHIKVNPL